MQANPMAQWFAQQWDVNRQTQSYYENENDGLTRKIVKGVLIAGGTLAATIVISVKLPGYWRPLVGASGGAGATYILWKAKRPIDHRSRNKATVLGLQTAEINGVETAQRTMFEHVPVNDADILSVGLPAQTLTNDPAEAAIVQVMQEFDAPVELINRIEGPSFVRYMFKPGRTVKGALVSVKAIQSRAEDIQIALNIDETPLITLSNGAIVIDVPREDRQVLRYSDWVKPGNYGWQSIKMAIGVSLTGQLVELDFADPNTPHNGGGGTTGSGKSEGLRTGALSLIDRYSPQVAQLAIIDGSSVSFQEFEGAPHLIAPIAKSPEDAIALLNKLDAMIDERYKLFEQHGVKDLKGYNSKFPNAPLPRVLIFFDEYGFLMERAKQADTDLRGYIDSPCRAIAQNGRKAGIQFAGIFTQKPLVRNEQKAPGGIDTTLWGNIPVRSGYAVQTQKESEIIMGEPGYGCEKLLGKGDLWLRTKSGVERLQSLWIGNADIMPGDDTSEAEMVISEAIERAIGRWGGSSHSELRSANVEEDCSASDWNEPNEPSGIELDFSFDALFSPIEELQDEEESPDTFIPSFPAIHENPKFQRLLHIREARNEGITRGKIVAKWGGTLTGRSSDEWRRWYDEAVFECGSHWVSELLMEGNSVQDTVKAVWGNISEQAYKQQCEDWVKSIALDPEILYTTYRKARESGDWVEIPSTDQFICQTFGCTSQSVDLKLLKAELRKAIELYLDQWVKEATEQGVGKNKLVAIISGAKNDKASKHVWHDAEKSVLFSEWKKAIEDAIDGIG